MGTFELREEDDYDFILGIEFAEAREDEVEGHLGGDEDGYCFPKLYSFSENRSTEGNIVIPYYKTSTDIAVGNLVKAVFHNQMVPIFSFIGDVQKTSIWFGKIRM